jgi:hypothetical protein
MLSLTFCSFVSLQEIRTGNSTKLSRATRKIVESNYKWKLLPTVFDELMSFGYRMILSTTYNVIQQSSIVILFIATSKAIKCKAST